EALDRVGRRGRVGEQTGAREDAELVSIENPVVDADGQPEIIRVDDESPQHGQLLGIRKTRAASAPPASKSRQGARSRSTRATVSRFSNVTCSRWTISHEVRSGASPWADSARTCRSGRDIVERYNSTPAPSSLPISPHASASP